MSKTFCNRAILILPSLFFAMNLSYGSSDTLKIGALEDTLNEENNYIGVGIGDGKEDIVKFGLDVEIDEGERVEGDVLAIGGSILIRGFVGGDAVAVGGSIEVDSTGEIDGDAVAVGGSVEKMEGGKIGGEEVSIGLGGIPSLKLGEQTFFKRSFSLIGKVIRMSILLIIALLLIVFLPKPIERIENTVRRRFFATLGVGILGEILICPLLLALTISIIGIPLVPLAILAIMAGLLLGYAGVSLLLGRNFIERVNMKSTTPIMAIVFGIILIELVSLLGRLIGLGGDLFHAMGIFLSVLGFLITYIAWTVGIGATVLSRFGTREPFSPSGVSTMEGSK